jgi:hypothetical protein
MTGTLAAIRDPERKTHTYWGFSAQGLLSGQEPERFTHRNGGFFARGLAVQP